MEPRIRYAITVDGVSIAFWTLGKANPSFTWQGGLAAKVAAYTAGQVLNERLGRQLRGFAELLI